MLPRMVCTPITAHSVSGAYHSVTASFLLIFNYSTTVRRAFRTVISQIPLKESMPEATSSKAFIFMVNSFLFIIF